MYSYTYDRKSKSWSRKVVLNLLSRLLTNSYILYKLTVRNSKSRLEFIKDVIDSLASESKAIVGDPVEPPSATKDTYQVEKKGNVLCAQIKKTMLTEEVELYAVHAKKVFMHYVF